MLQKAIHQTNLADGLDRQNHLTLTRIYQHPLSHNLELRAVTRLFKAIGMAEIQHNGEIGLHIGDEALTLACPHGKDLGTEDVVLVRHFHERTGWSPTAEDSSEPDLAMRDTAASPDMVILIDHTGARVHQIGVRADVRHIRHYIDPNAHDADREATFPADQRFFSEIADIVATAARIVVVSHGKGQSNEGEHLVAWLHEHRNDVSANVISPIAADLRHMTEPELLDLAGQALAQSASNATLKDQS